MTLALVDPKLSHLMDHDRLPERLKQAVQKVGGTRHVAYKTGISEAQLHRYYSGSPIPSNKLVLLAKACHVRISWLFSEACAK